LNHYESSEESGQAHLKIYTLSRPVLESPKEEIET